MGLILKMQQNHLSTKSVYDSMTDIGVELMPTCKQFDWK